MKLKLKKWQAVILGLMASLCLTCMAFAESVGTANAQVTGAMTTIANDMLATGTAIIPIALTTVGMAMVVIFGIRIFKRVAGK